MKKSTIVSIGFAAILSIPSHATEIPNPDHIGEKEYTCPVDVMWVAGEPGRLTEDRDAIEQLMNDWTVAVAEADLETIASLVTEDCEFWTDGASPLMGRQDLVGAFETFLEKHRMKQQFDCQELVISGNWAFMRGLEVNHLTPVDGSESIVRRQRAFSVLYRSNSGEWLFARGMTNHPPDS